MSLRSRTIRGCRHPRSSTKPTFATGPNYIIQTSSDLISLRDLSKITGAQSRRVILDGLPTNAERVFTASILREPEGVKSLMTTHDDLEAELAARDKFRRKNSGSACRFWRC